ncbi:MAG: DUF5684 domain-containing protein [Armatimonadota bacterium]
MDWIYLLGHILIALAVFIIAHKSEHPWSWLAFVPIANLWLMCDMADVEIWYMLLYFVPLINVIVYVWLWMRIAENTNKPSWLGLLMLVPFVNVGAAVYMALYEPDVNLRSVR